MGGWKGYEISEFRLVFVCGRGLESTSKSILYHLTNLSRKNVILFCVQTTNNKRVTILNSNCIWQSNRLVMVESVDGQVDRYSTAVHAKNLPIEGRQLSHLKLLSFNNQLYLKCKF